MIQKNSLWLEEKRSTIKLLDILVNKSLESNLYILSIDIALLTMSQNYSILKSNNNEFNNITKNNIKNIVNILKHQRYLVEWLYIVPELDDSGKEHYHCIIAIKTLVNYNNHVKINFVNELRLLISLDININILYSFEKLTHKLNYILKQSYPEYEKYDYVEKRYHKRINTHINLNYHEFWANNQILLENNVLVNHLKKFINVYELPIWKIRNSDFGSMNEVKAQTWDSKTIIYMLNWYCVLNDIRFNDGFLYKKIKESDSSYIQYHAVTWLKHNLDNIYKSLIENFDLFIKGIDIIKLISTIDTNVELINNLLMVNEMNKNLKHVFNIIEFKNGYYFFEYNKFINKNFMKKHNYKIPDNILVIKYYNVTYSRNYVPKTWIKKLYNALEFNNTKTFDLLASYIANTVIKDPDVFEKKKVLYIWGESSTGKTTIVANPLWHYFGEENVGILSTSKNFQLESLVKKELGVLDEYRYSQKRRELDLKLFEGQPIKVDIKYKDQEGLRDLKIIALSNFSINPDDYEENDLKRKRTDKALANRTQIMKFIKRDTIENPDNIEPEDIKKIEEEVPFIMIYCNRILFNKFVKNRGKTKNKLLLEKMTKNEYLEIDYRIIDPKKQLNDLNLY